MTLHRALPEIADVERLAALARFNILDTPPERQFDEIADLAADLCDAPVALVSLVAQDRQWFKARSGFDETETPIGQAICVHVVASRRYIEIEDTLSDPRTQDNPLCGGAEGARFYAGTPLISTEGHALGTLCVLDYRPRVLTDRQRNALQVLGRQVVTQMELRQSVEMAALLRSEIDHRVKNSLQSLASLARVEASASSSPELRQSLKSFEARIAAVSLVHDQLYRTGAISEVALRGYLENLAEALRGMLPPTVVLTSDFCDAVVASSRAAALGILVSEVLSNALKHAFADGRPGTLRLSTRLLAGGKIRFEGSDDGSGLDPHSGSNGIGMKIATAISSQLGGQLEVIPGNPGLTVAVTFPAQA